MARCDKCIEKYRCWNFHNIKGEMRECLEQCPGFKTRYLTFGEVFEREQHKIEQIRKWVDEQEAPSDTRAVELLELPESWGILGVTENEDGR